MCCVLAWKRESDSSCCVGTVGLQKTGFSSHFFCATPLHLWLVEAQGPKNSELMAPGTSGLENSKTCSACGKIKSRVDFGKKGEDAPLKKSTIDDDGVTVETGLRSPSPGPSASTKVKVTPGIDETDL